MDKVKEDVDDSKKKEVVKNNADDAKRDFDLNEYPEEEEPSS